MEVSHKLEIDKDIQSLNRALSQTADDHPRMPTLLDRLGSAHHERFQILNELEDLEKAIEYRSIALTLTPDTDPGLSELLFTLASAHSQRFQHLGDLHDIEKAIEYGHISIGLGTDSDGDSALPLRLLNLGTSHSMRFERLGEASDLEDAIQYKSRAVALTPIGNTHLPGILNSLGVSHRIRFRRLGDMNELEKAIEYETRALALASNGHPHLPGIFNSLGAAHIDRFERLGELRDLESAIEYQSRALALTPNGHPDLPGRMTNLGMHHRSRFERLGELGDLEDAIKYKTRSVALTPHGNPNLPSRLMNLGLSHRDRFRRLGEPNDVENAIEYQSRALALTPDGHPHLPRIFTNLGASHMDRFDRLDELSDLESAIKYQSQAAALTPDGHPDLPAMITNLGVSCKKRFQRLGELHDLESAIEYQSRALALTPDGHPGLPGRLTNIALSHRNRYKHLDEQDDLEHAIKYESRALALTLDNHPDASKQQFNHAHTYLLYYQKTRDHSHLRHSLDLFRSASQSLSGAPRDKFGNAQTWASIASMHDPGSCIEAYQTAIDLLPQVMWLGVTTNQRYQDLALAGNLAVDAASAAIRSSNHSLALEWLEHTRCVVWNQSLMLRSPVDELQAIHPDLGMRLQTVANQLHSVGLGSREFRTLTSGSLAAEQVAQEHHRLAKEHDELLAGIRKLPGFEEFLRPMKARALVQAARTGPVVMINCHTDHCDALFILPGEETVGHVPLPNFSVQKAQEARHTLESSLRSKGVRERGVKVRQEPGHKYDISSVLATLWHNVVKPILDHLGYTENSSSDTLPHITWCPTSTLSFLPLHAAGDYDQPRSRIFDYVVSSYTPTLTALLASGPDSLSTSCRVLAIGQASTPGHSALPGTARELSCVQVHTSKHSQCSQLMGSQATVTAVLDAMERHDWVHLACHAHQNVSHPTKSGFFLHDGTLDLATINRRSFKRKGLAFLSACQTATGDDRLADESVHLASGMLMAGYSSVIATMWSVHDQDAPLVADKVYARLMQDRRVGNGEAGRALHNAVAILRETVGEQKFERWVPYIHIGS
ncbi:unnamed protein product [Rhizoctonia solani]|uniref:CHAT domain-containing protein n=2 Tax=Rhizoctonia solani TaxID=456999 RepID=A0A8H3D8A4_9AGAM